MPRPAAIVALSLALTGGTTAGALAWAQPSRPYYLSLGDSLSQGYQPTPGQRSRSADTDQGYANVVAAALAPRLPGLRLVKLGCPGETTSTYLRGGICHRTGGSQQAAAVSFLAAHRSQVRLITIDMGINDVIRCESRPASYACVTRGLSTIAAQLPRIIGAIRADGGGAVVVGLDYYAPFVSVPGSATSSWSTAVTERLNSELGSIYSAHHVPVADVAGAFRTGDLTAVRTASGARPADTVAVCELTWMCAPRPFGPNLHANAAGYRAMARAVESVLDQFPALGGRARLADATPGLQHDQVG